MSIVHKAFLVIKHFQYFFTFLILLVFKAVCVFFSPKRDLCIYGLNFLFFLSLYFLLNFNNLLVTFYLINPFASTFSHFVILYLVVFFLILVINKVLPNKSICSHLPLLFDFLLYCRCLKLIINKFLPGHISVITCLLQQCKEPNKKYSEKIRCVG